jgi:anti-anti-sigma regulatory factor
MAKNFTITTHTNSGFLYLTLGGDFDGISAHELIDMLRQNSSHYSKIFIDTGAMCDIHPFGVDVLQSYFDRLKGSPSEFVFTGENALRLAPNKPPTLDISISAVPPDSGSGKFHKR